MPSPDIRGGGGEVLVNFTMNSRTTSGELKDGIDRVVSAGSSLASSLGFSQSRSSSWGELDELGEDCLYRRVSDDGEGVPQPNESFVEKVAFESGGLGAGGPRDVTPGTSPPIPNACINFSAIGER